VCVCVSVCLSASISPDSTSKPRQISLGSALCTSGFVDDVILFTHSGPYGMLSIALQQVLSLCRRAQANDPTATNWLRRVLDDGVRRDCGRVHRARGAGGGACSVLLPFHYSATSRH